MKEPKIRFKEFKGEWEEHSLSENEFSIVAGGDIDKTYLKNSGKFPVIANAITNDGILGYYENSYRVQEPAVTVTGRGEVGIAVARHYSFTPVVRLLSIKSPHNVDFLANAINCYKVPVESTGVPQLTTAKLQEYRIPMPRTIEEEDAIASFFTTIDAQISASTSRLASLKQIKAASLQAMFPQEGETVPKLRFKGFEGEWKTSLVGEVCKISTGKSNTQDKIEDGEFPFYVRSPYVERSNKYLYDEEAVLTVGDGVGTGKVFHYVNGKYDLHQRVYRMFDFHNIQAKYFYYLFSTQFYKRVMSMTAKSSVDSVRMDMIADMKINVPAISEQQSIASYFTNLDRQITLQTNRLEKLKQIKAACLDKMFV